MIDGMSVRKFIEWDQSSQKMVGFVDMGMGPGDDDSRPEATEIIVIMAVGILGRWKAPLGYFCIHGITGNTQASLISMCLEKLHESGVRAVSVTSDGTSYNQQMAARLGVKLDPQNMQATFPHPSDQSVHVAFIFDACHMVKLVRNMMSTYKRFMLPGVGIVDWVYIERLMELQQEEKLSAGNKVSDRHVHYQNEKMKVNLAVQVLSSSVADALEFARRIGKAEFHGCEATVQFIRTVDRLFDILNSRNCRGKGYKAPIGKWNIGLTLWFLVKAREELKSLKDMKGEPLYLSRRKMGIVGLLVDIESTIWLAHSLVLQEDIPCTFLLMYKFSQDHLELYFGAVRAAGGHKQHVDSSGQLIGSYFPVVM